MKNPNIAHVEPSDALSTMHKKETDRKSQMESHKEVECTKNSDSSPIGKKKSRVMKTMTTTKNNSLTC